MDLSKEYIKMCDCPEIQLTAEATYCVVRDNGHSWLLPNNCAVGAEGRYWHQDGNRRIWLPSQRQLQGMLPFKNYDYWFTLCFQFLNTEYEHKTQTYETMEQLWLAFIMFELHQKKWDDGKWI